LAISKHTIAAILRLLSYLALAAGVALLVRYELQPAQFGVWKLDRWTGKTWACYLGAGTNQCVELLDDQRTVRAGD